METTTIVIMHSLWKSYLMAMGNHLFKRAFKSGIESESNLYMEVLIRKPSYKSEKNKAL
jgi:hypothetical protein